MDADAPRALECTITEVNYQGVCVDTGDENSFPWNGVVGWQPLCTQPRFRLHLSKGALQNPSTASGQARRRESSRSTTAPTALYR